ncbi:MAG: aspartate/glutamate racemase family protein, partial [Endomicrobium sp.]|nr:aspartate/glutamate racemase family protein [Endomicrobium sp.]
MQKKQRNKKINNNPIGIFDSGFGGLTVMSAINKALPLENLIYFGDTAHVPYGTKSKNVVIKFSKEIVAFLMEHKVKLIVIACNTASAFALPILQKTLKVPVISVIEPGSKADAVLHAITISFTLCSIKKATISFENFITTFFDFVPYGTKSKNVVIKFSKEIVAFLMEHKVKLIVIACNTASAFALR